MATQKYRVETDKGAYEIEVEVPAPTVTPVSVDEPGMGGGDSVARFISQHVPGGDYLLGAQKGMAEGIRGGAKGYMEGLIPGVVQGVKDTVRLPLWLMKEGLETAKGAQNLYNDPSKTLTDAGNAIAAFPGKVADATSAAARKARTDPEGFGKDVGQLTGATEVGVVGSKAVPLAGRPIGQQTGRVLQAIGEQGKWPIRMMGAHQLGSGNPLGIMTMALPEQLQKGGQSLRIAAGEEPAVVRLGDKAAQKIQDQFDDAMARRNVSFYDEQQAAKQNAENLDAIRKARQGMKEDTSFSKTTSATTPAGKESMTTRFEPAEEAGVPGSTLSPEDKLVVQLQKQNPGMPEAAARKAAKAYFGTDNEPMPTKAVLQVGRPTTPAPSAPVKLDQQAMEDNIRSRASFGYGHVMPEPVPTELDDAAVEGSEPHRGTFVMEHGVGATVPKDLTVEAGNPEVPGVTVGSAGKGTPLALNPNPQRPAIRISPSPDLDRMMASTPGLSPATANVRNVGDFMKAVDDALAGAKSKSKSGSGQWRNLSDNDAITAMNAYSSGVRNPQEVLQAILEKRKGRQATHVSNYYLDKQTVPEE